MTNKFDPAKLYLHRDKHDDRRIVCLYDGVQYPKAGTIGVRQHFNIQDMFFIKTENMLYSNYTQCKIESKCLKKIKPEDRKFFSKLLAHSDFTTDIHWTVFKFMQLVEVDRIKKEKLIELLQKKVKVLCRTYKIDDVENSVNMNWFVHRDRPLIVDVGVRR